MPTTTQQVKAFYDEYHKNSTRHENLPSWIKDYWTTFTGTVLEIGCGTIIPQYPKEKYTGIDLSHSAAEKNKKRGFATIVGDFVAHSFEKKFDTVACHDVIEHVTDIDAFLNKMVSLAKKKVVILGPNYVGKNFLRKRKKDYFLRVLQYFFVKKIYKLENPNLTLDDNWASDMDAVSAVNVRYITEFLQKHGFKIIKKDTWLFRKAFNKIPFLKSIGAFMWIEAVKE